MIFTSWVGHTQLPEFYSHRPLTPEVQKVFVLHLLFTPDLKVLMLITPNPVSSPPLDTSLSISQTSNLSSWMTDHQQNAGWNSFSCPSVPQFTKISGQQNCVFIKNHYRLPKTKATVSQPKVLKTLHHLDYLPHDGILPAGSPLCDHILDQLWCSSAVVWNAYLPIPWNQQLVEQAAAYFALECLSHTRAEPFSDFQSLVLTRGLDKRTSGPHILNFIKVLSGFWHNHRDGCLCLEQRSGISYRTNFPRHSG